MKKILPLLFLISFASKLNAQISGCPDRAANNYNSLATVNDGSCTYNDITLTPTLKFNFNTVLNESSGLLNWKSLIWSHNDSGNGPDIYGMNSTTGTIQRSVFISNATNVDWE